MMVKIFAADDIQEITDACYIMGVNQVWCRILFKGCTTPHEFCTHPISESEFSRDLYERLKGGQFGELSHGTGLYRTQPAEQAVVEASIISKRNQLLLESDYADMPITQARLSDEKKTAWANYRQALRDLTDQKRFPWDPEWPTKP